GRLDTAGARARGGRQPPGSLTCRCSPPRGPARPRPGSSGCPGDARGVRRFRVPVLRPGARHGAGAARPVARSIEYGQANMSVTFPTLLQFSDVGLLLLRLMVAAVFFDSG